MDTSAKQIAQTLSRELSRALIDSKCLPPGHVVQFSFGVFAAGFHVF